MRGSGYGLDANLKPMGYVKLVDPDGSLLTLTPDSNGKKAVYALIIPEGDIRYRDDGELPTATEGMPLLAEQPLFYTGPLHELRMVGVNPGAVVNILLYR